jgi:hypothetical protein
LKKTLAATSGNMTNSASRTKKKESKRTGKTGPGMRKAG